MKRRKSHSGYWSFTHIPSPGISNGVVVWGSNQQPQALQSTTVTTTQGRPQAAALKCSYLSASLMSGNLAQSPSLKMVELLITMMS